MTVDEAWALMRVNELDRIIDMMELDPYDKTNWGMLVEYLYYDAQLPKKEEE